MIMSMATKTKSIFTTHEVSRLLQVNPRSVINWIEQDLLASYRTPGGHRRIRREDLLAFLRKHQIPTPASLVDGKFNILVVEDEEEIAKLLKAYFDRQGNYAIHLASDGISALIEVGRVKPDLLILDIMIPGVDGVEVCRRIKSDSAKQNGHRRHQRQDGLGTTRPASRRRRLHGQTAGPPRPSRNNQTSAARPLKRTSSRPGSVVPYFLGLSRLPRACSSVG